MEKFREYFAKVAETTVLHYNSGPLLWPRFRAVFIEDKEALDGASNELRARFRKMRNGDGGEHLPKGIRTTTCFLVADKTVIEDAAAKAPCVPRYVDDLLASVDTRPGDPVVFIRAVDPDYNAAAQTTVTKQLQGEDNVKGGEAKGDEVGTGSIAKPVETPETKQSIKKEVDEMRDFEGDATIMLPKVFDWLHHVCFVASALRGSTSASAGTRSTCTPRRRRSPGSVTMRPTQEVCHMRMCSDYLSEVRGDRSVIYARGTITISAGCQFVDTYMIARLFLLQSTRGNGWQRSYDAINKFLR
jgi:hypothetical protein